MPKAEIISITTGRPVDLSNRAPLAHQRGNTSDAMDLLRSIASRAAEEAADPSALAHPDQELLGLCDQILMLCKREAEALDEWRNAPFPHIGQTQLHIAWKQAQRAIRSPLLRAAKLPAKTAAGIYAKALAVRHTGPTGSTLGKSLADDLMMCSALRAVLCPAGAA